MSDSVQMDVSDDVKVQVEALWAKVFESVTTVIRQTKTFSFAQMETGPVPNIHQMLATLQIFDDVIDVLVKNASSFGLEYEHTRPLLNCKVQIANMERMAAALQANDQDEYATAVKALETQAPF